MTINSEKYFFAIKGFNKEIWLPESIKRVIGLSKPEILIKGSLRLSILFVRYDSFQRLLDKNFPL